MCQYTTYEYLCGHTNCEINHQCGIRNCTLSFSTDEVRDICSTCQLMWEEPLCNFKIGTPADVLDPSTPIFPSVLDEGSYIEHLEERSITASRDSNAIKATIDPRLLETPCADFKNSGTLLTPFQSDINLVLGADTTSPSSIPSSLTWASSHTASGALPVTPPIHADRHLDSRLCVATPATPGRHRRFSNSYSLSPTPGARDFQCLSDSSFALPWEKTSREHQAPTHDEDREDSLMFRTIPQPDFHRSSPPELSVDDILLEDWDMPEGFASPLQDKAPSYGCQQHTSELPRVEWPFDREYPSTEPVAEELPQETPALPISREESELQLTLLLEGGARQASTSASEEQGYKPKYIWTKGAARGTAEESASTENVPVDTNMLPMAEIRFSLRIQR